MITFPFPGPRSGPVPAYGAGGRPRNSAFSRGRIHRGCRGPGKVNGFTGGYPSRPMQSTQQMADQRHGRMLWGENPTGAHFMGISDTYEHGGLA